MAILTADQLQEFRAACALEMDVRYNKSTINAVMQAIEDLFETNAFSAPIVFTAAEKRALVKFWLYSRFRRGN